MGTAIDPVLISRLSGEFETLGNQMWALGRDLEVLRFQVASERVGRRAEDSSAASAVEGEARAGESRTGVAEAGDVQTGMAPTDARAREASAGDMRTGEESTGGSRRGVAPNTNASTGAGRAAEARAETAATSSAAASGASGMPVAAAGSEATAPADVTAMPGASVPSVAAAESGAAGTPDATVPPGSIGTPGGSVPWAATGTSAATGSSGVTVPPRAGTPGATGESGAAGTSAAAEMSGTPVPGATGTPGASGTSSAGRVPQAGGDRVAVGPPDASGVPQAGGDRAAAGAQAAGGVPRTGVPPAGAYVPQTGGYPPAGERFAPGGWGSGVAYGVPPSARGVPPVGRGWGAPVGAAWRPPERVKRTPWWQQEGVISRVLAVAGVGVTLIGVVMLLVLAAQAGFFGPVPRVVTGVVFSAALVAAGVRVYGRSGGQVGGIALAATGIAGGYLNVVGVTTVYEWLPPVVGLVLASAVAAAGVWLAMRWNSQTLAVLVVAGAAVLSPVVTVELALLGFLIVLQAACVPVQLARNWPILHVIRTAPAVLATLAAITVATFDEPDRARLYWLLTAAVAIAVVGLAGTVLAVRERSGDFTATITLAMAATPLLAAPVMFERRTSVLIAGLFAAVLLAVAATAVVPNQRLRQFIPPHTAITAAVAGSFALLEACIGVTTVQTLPTALFLVALGFLGVAGQLRNAVATGLGAMFAALAALVFLDSASPETLAVQRFAEEQLGIATLLAALLALAVVVVGVWAVRRLPGISGDIADAVVWVAGSLAGLYAVTTATVSIGVATGAADGFLIGHSAATITWMIAATAALLYGLRKLSRSPAVAKLALGSGLLVTAAALAKLFLFDLATLDGLVRVAAFLIVGVLLLLAGTRYARAFADAGSEDQPTQ